MTATMIATPEPEYVPPRIRLDLDAGSGSAFSTINVRRNGTLLRNQPPVGGQVSVLYDYDVPYGEPVSYSATGTLLPPATPDWTETWPNLTNWAGDTGSFSVSSGVLSSVVGDAVITRDAAGDLQRLQVATPENIRVELRDVSDVVRAHITSQSGKVTLVSNGTTVLATGSGSYTVSLVNGVISVTADDSSWSLEQQYTGTVVRVALVSLGGSFGLETSFGLSGDPNSSPSQSAVDSSGNHYIAFPSTSGGPYTRKHSPTGTVLQTFTGYQGVAVDAADNVYTVKSDLSAVLRYDSGGTETLSIAGTGVHKVAVNSAGTRIYRLLRAAKEVKRHDNTGTLNQTISLPEEPSALTVDSSDNVYVLFGISGKVRKYDTSGTLTATYTLGFTYQDNVGIAVDGSGKIYVAAYFGASTAAFIIYSSAGALIEYVPGSYSYTIAVSSDGEKVYRTGYGPAASRYEIQSLQAGTTIATSEVTPQQFEATAESTELDVNEAWLIHPTTPSLSVMIDPGPDGCRGPECGEDGVLTIDPTSKETTNYAANVSVHSIIGSRLDVVVSSGRRAAGVWTLVLSGSSITHKEDLLLLLDDQQPVLLNFPASWEYDLETGWFAVFDFIEKRIVQRLPVAERQFDLPLQQVAEPVLQSSFGHTFADLLTEGHTFGTLLDTYGSFLNVLTGDPQ